LCTVVAQAGTTLDVAHGVEAEPLRGALGDDLDDLGEPFLGALDLDEVEVRRRVRRGGQFGHLPVVHAPRIDDGAAGGGLAEDLGQADDRQRA
jgi:hypothetical protein